jgi:exopolyphosphatase/guanosine-5'-triphosphate,3'-diphosphate pyrophosphatase
MSPASYLTAPPRVAERIIAAATLSVMRVAAVDLGTNSTRLLVADIDDGRVEDLARETRITRLGEGVDERRRLLPLPIARVRNTLSDFRRQTESLGAERTLLVATSAVRDAENGEAFLGEIEWSYGFATRLVSGEEEADLTYRGVTAGRAFAPGTIVVDLGGGSTELVSEGLRISLDVGSVRLTERFLASDPPTPSELEAAAAAVRAALAERVPDDVRASTTAAIGVAGTVTTLAALDLGLVEYDRERVHGHRIASAAIDELLARLAALPVAERRELPGLEPERAPVIVGGVVIVRELLRHLGLDELEVSEHDLLDGIALEAAELPVPVEGDAPPGAYTCC